MLLEVKAKSFASPAFLRQAVLTVFLTLVLAVSPWFYGLTLFKDQLLAESLIFFASFVFLAFSDLRGVLNKGWAQMDHWVLRSALFLIPYFFISALPYQSLLAFAKFTSLVFFYVLMRVSLQDPSKQRLFLWVFVLSGTAYAFYGLLQYHGYAPHEFWFQPADLASRYVNSGHFAVLLLFALTSGASLFFSSERLSAKGVLAFCLFVTGWALMLTRSRTSWLAGVSGAGIFCWGLYRGVATEKKRRALMGLVLGILALGALLTFGGIGHSILERLRDLEGTRFYSLWHRWHLWEGSIRAIEERPWGWGLGIFSVIFPLFRVQADRFFVDYAHNELLQVGVDLGIPGAVFLLLWIFFCLAKLFSFVRRAEERTERLAGVGLLSLLAMLTLASLMDFPLRIYANGFYFAASLALAASLLEGGQFSPRKTKIQGGWVKPYFMISAFLLGTLTTTQLFAEIHFQKGKVLEKDFEWENALEAYGKASRLAPFYGPYHEARAFLFQQKASLALKRGDKKKFRKEAIGHYLQAAEVFPYRAHTHYALALLFEKEKNFEAAKAQFLEAARLDPMNGFYLSEYARFALRHSLLEEAVGAYEKLKVLTFWGNAKENICGVLRRVAQETQEETVLRRITPNRVEGRLCLAQVFGEIGRWDLVSDELKIVFERAQWEKGIHVPSIYHTISSFYLDHQRKEEGLAVFRRASEAFPEDAEIRKKAEELSALPS